ncbi:MAG: hypothetical protein NC120_00775 [Ruminococcus sp.]|nr:hypothetical protein [Ruminococcus sp.]
MKKSDRYSGFGRMFAESSAVAAAVTYGLGIVFVILGVSGYGDMSDERRTAFAVCGMLVLLTNSCVQAAYALSRQGTGPLSEFVTAYDTVVIGSCFRFGSKRNIFYAGLKSLWEGDLNSALDDFRELKSAPLSDREQGVLGFYTAICYNRMGYPTNAGMSAAVAVEKKIRLPESLLMAARSFSLAANYSVAAEYYTQLLPIAEEHEIFPTIYNEMGRMYLSANMLEESRRSFEASLDNGYDPVTAQGGLAIVSLLEGNEDQACELYRLALIARIPDVNGYKEYCAQICAANGYPENFFEEHLRQRYARRASNSERE